MGFKRTGPTPRLIKIPAPYYNELRAMQKELYEKKMVKEPLWRCITPVEMKKQRWKDDEWFK